jgi:serine phosphatase RsbU (regulator of sigma subunit)
MINRFVKYFLNNKDARDPEKAMQGRYFILSTVLFFLLTFLAYPYYILVVPEQIDSNPELFWANLLFSAIIFGLLFVYKKWGLRIILVNIMTSIGFMSNFQTYQLGGALWSTDLMWGIIISAWVFLVADRWSGTFWMFMTMLAYMVMFPYMESSDHDFLADATKMGPSYPLINYLLGAIFLLLIIWMYDAAKRKFLNALRESKSEIEIQKKELESQKEDIIASIQYAKKIQQAVLPHEEIVSRGIPLSFFLYKPRDIVSGDFYWFHELDRDNYILAVADCTGHGVPGAFMTVIGSNLLTQIVKDNGITSPANILAQLDLRINETLKQDHARYSEVQDGMDLSIIHVNKGKREFIYTSAKRTAFLLRNGSIQELKGSKFSIGGMRSGTKTFEEITVQYQDDDLLYLFTDGYIDQFGGPENKKFMIKRFRELVQKISKLPMPDQKQQLNSTIQDWIRTNEQTDDILVCGIRF